MGTVSPKLRQLLPWMGVWFGETHKATGQCGDRPVLQRGWGATGSPLTTTLCILDVWYTDAFYDSNIQILFVLFF